jgi:hypothetical protein
MPFLLLLALAFYLSAPLPSPEIQDEELPRLTFHVDPRGDDSWSGRVEAVNATGDDGPFATPHRAQRAVREALAARGSSVAIDVCIHDGFYELTGPLRFTPEDSGVDDVEVTWAAKEGARPILSGGRRIRDWKIDEAGRWRTVLPEVRDGTWSFSQAWVDDQRRFRPFLPHEGYHTIAEQVSPTDAVAGKGHDRMGYHPGDLELTDDELRDTEVFAFHIWSASRMRIAEIDRTEHLLTFTGPTRTSARWGAFLEGHRWRLDNAPLEHALPGQWRLDRTTGELVYLPLPGETPDDCDFVVPRLEQVVRFEGDPAQRRFVRHVDFHGLTFAHTSWNLPAAGQSFPQAEVHLSAAVEAVGARRVRFLDCAVRHTGGYGVSFGAGCRNDRLVHCDLLDLGAGGVKIGTGGGPHSWMIGEFDPEDPEQAVERITVDDCRIAHGGRLHPAAVGVWIGHASHCRIEQNDIHDFYYTGVSVGWTWGYAEPSRAHHNVITDNHIREIGQGVLSDMAGVYTLGVSPGTRVVRNKIHDVDAYDYGGWGLYTDEGSSHIEMTDNLVYRTKTGGFHQHYGRENWIDNNIFIEAEIQQLQRTRTEEHLSFTFTNNIVYWTSDSPLLGSNWRDDNFKLDQNFYWNPNLPDIRFPGDLTFEEWREERGQDRHSMIVDPLFIDPANDDWRLAPDSPAEAYGFLPLEIDPSGCRPERALEIELPPVPAGFHE